MTLLVLLMLALTTGMIVATILGAIAFGLARWTGSTITQAINRAALVTFSAMTLFIAALGILVPALT